MNNSIKGTFYLCRVRSSMDDVPFLLTANYQEAVDAANKIPWEMTETLLEATDTPNKATPVKVDIVTFCDGIPIDQETIREFDEEEDEENDEADVV